MLFVTVRPPNEGHFFMAASSKRHGGGFRLIRHNTNTARFLRELLSDFGSRKGTLAGAGLP